MTYQRYRCTVCGHIYDPAEGDPEAGIPAGTLFEDIPDTWVCPDCGATKADFEPYED
ncbi:MAG TPA: rubredoxin [Candidatus Bathyarchaeia archaeon]|nr:rubredoxin [Candidatus Bathyarchaeia archaeon]